ncbi:acyltransferase [Mucilaginibacter sp. RS28]|uniref:Acyltransferase n=1 Tax=Mucilaginibacter straminoryzae TaxID=2932774 RepID=A0A9X1X805_9SPHI|nr:acyltransferase [Mucilaginibacter straminoryzae]MCJ8211855.1 acyltransferase [Mucilaginibacter straminoryzae]
MKYKFVDFIRFWSMVTIIYEHAIFLTEPAWQLHHPDLMRLLILPAKFGGIAFFIISGFLLGDKLHEQKPLNYLKRRFNTIFMPYLVAMLGYFAFTSQKYVRMITDVNTSSDAWSAGLFNHFTDVVFFTAYWFIWVFFISLSIILLFRRQLNTLAFPLIALAISFFYGVNIYYNFVPTAHTTAILGYVFYLWLGIFINQHKIQFFKIFGKIPTAYIAFTALLFLSISFYEGSWINSIRVYLNTLKISNQLYSLSMFLLLLKLSEYKVPAFFKPRQETYGIYLYHMFFISVFGQITFHTALKDKLNLLSNAGYIAFYLAVFVIVYMGTTLLVKAINKTSLSWLTGKANKKAAANEEIQPAEAKLSV